MDPNTEHILLIPFMAQGHLRPFLELAYRLHSHNNNFIITLLTTPLNANSLRLLLPPSSPLKIVDLPFNSSDHGLPPDIETTSKLPLHQVISLFHSSTSLKPHLLSFISTNFAPSHPPLCIIFDAFFGWANDVARTVGSPGIAFNTGGAYGAAGYVSVWDKLPHRNLRDDEFFSPPGFPKTHLFQRSQLHRFVRYADGSDGWSMFFQPQLRLSMGSSGWLCNSVEEIEPLGFELLKNYIKLPVWGIGPLVPSLGEKPEMEVNEGLQWLDSQSKDSVLYISFGSQNTCSVTQMMELASGLELSEKPFLWVIRPPFGFDINGEMKPEWLPEGFEERMKGKNQGILVHKWAPQLEILRHESTGGFLTHCGWNSVLESLREGVPMIGWPLAAEQVYNSKLLEKVMGVGFELTIGLEGELSKEKVKKVAEMVLGREEGSEGWGMKKAAIEMGRKLKDAMEDEGEYKGSSMKAMDDFISTMISLRQSNKSNVLQRAD